MRELTNEEFTATAKVMAESLQKVAVAAREVGRRMKMATPRLDRHRVAAASIAMRQTMAKMEEDSCPTFTGDQVEQNQ